MPFDFVKFKPYSINYSELINEFNSIKILDDSHVQTHYLKRWIETLENSDKILTKELSTSKAILELQFRLQSEPEIFQVPMYFSNTEILLHFRISITNKLIANEKSKSQHIPLDEFLKNNSNIKWTPVDIDVKKYANSKSPIIIVPFQNNQYNFLVIDGNHRLTYKTKYLIDDIHALTIAEESVITNLLFASGFDKLYYIMQNEINYIANATHGQNAKAIEILQKSYLTDGKFKFH